MQRPRPATFLRDQHLVTKTCRDVKFSCAGLPLSAPAVHETCLDAALRPYFRVALPLCRADRIGLTHGVGRPGMRCLRWKAGKVVVTSLFLPLEECGCVRQSEKSTLDLDQTSETLVQLAEMRTWLLLMAIPTPPTVLGAVKAPSAGAMA